MKPEWEVRYSIRGLPGVGKQYVYAVSKEEAREIFMADIKESFPTAGDDYATITNISRVGPAEQLP